MTDSTDQGEAADPEYRQPLEQLSDYFSLLVVESGDDPTLQARLLEQLEMFWNAPASVDRAAEQAAFQRAIVDRMAVNLNTPAFRTAATYLTTYPTANTSRWRQIESRLEHTPILLLAARFSYSLYRRLRLMANKTSALAK